MSNKVIVEIAGTSVELDLDLLKAYKEEAFGYLNAEADAKNDFKEAVETQAETFGIDKKILTKYLKAAFKDATKAQSELGEIFAALDGAAEEAI